MADAGRQRTNVAAFVVAVLLVAGVALIAGAAWNAPDVRRLIADEPIQVRKHPSPDRMWFGAEGRLLLVSAEGRVARIESCDPSDGSCASARVPISTGASNAFAVHGDADTMTVAYVDGPGDRRVCFLELDARLSQRGERSCTPLRAGEPLTSIVLADARRAVVARSGGELEFVDARSVRAGAPSGTRLRGDWPLRRVGAFVVASDLDSGNFAVLDVAGAVRNQAAFYVCPEGSRPTVIGVLPGGDPVVGTADGSVLYPRGDSWIPLGPLPGAVRAMSVRDDGRVLVSGDFDGVHVIDLDDPLPRPVIGGLTEIAALASGESALALSRGGPVTVYRVGRELWVGRLFAHPLVWTGLALLASALGLGALLVSGSARGVAGPASEPSPASPAEVDVGADYRSVDAPPWRPSVPEARQSPADDETLTMDLDPRELSVGSVLGSYELRALLGSGAMGQVFEAWDRDIRRVVAVKVLTPEIGGDPQALARFKKEARALGAVSHPNVLGIYIIGEERGIAYVVTERLHGETLRTRLERGPLDAAEVRRIAIEIARGLDAAHRAGLVHRDIKPDNVFLTEDGVKVLDFGLARAIHDDPVGDRGGRPTVTRMTSPGALVGTFGYMSPEQAVGDPLDARSDLFALGCVMHEMLTGHGPFDREQRHESITALLRDSAPVISHGGDPLLRVLSEVITRCLRRQAEDRFASAGAVIEALGDVV